MPWLLLSPFTGQSLLFGHCFLLPAATGCRLFRHSFCDARKWFAAQVPSCAAITITRTRTQSATVWAESRPINTVLPNESNMTDCFFASGPATISLWLPCRATSSLDGSGVRVATATSAVWPLGTWARRWPVFNQILRSKISCDSSV
jgi:hypothetical protein